MDKTEKKREERIDDLSCFLHFHNNESNKCPGHEERMKAHHKRVEKEELKNSMDKEIPRGYYWDSSCQKYYARIMSNKKSIHLGYFFTAVEARRAYVKAKRKYCKKAKKKKSKK